MKIALILALSVFLSASAARAVPPSVLQQAQGEMLVIDQKITAPELQTMKLQHFYQGLEVVGSKAFYQFGKAGLRILDRVAHFNLDVVPNLSASRAASIAHGLVTDESLVRIPVLKILPDAQGGGARLVYWIQFKGHGLDSGRDIIIDAHSGELIGNIPRDLTIAPIQTYSAKEQGVSIQTRRVKDTNGNLNLDSCAVTDLSNGEIQTLDATACTSYANQISGTACQLFVDGGPDLFNPGQCQSGGNDPSVLRATSNAQKVLEYYSSHLGRNSYDDQGAPVVSVVHAGVNWINAHWSTDENLMTYGDGNVIAGFGDFTAAVDVAGHELTHGVTAHTAQLLNMDQSGALNEANSDFFGILIANGGTDWALGKAVFLDQTQGHAIRDLAHPETQTYCAGVDPVSGYCSARKPYPSKYSELIPDNGPCDSAANDMCWVHENATIPGHAAYLVTQAIGAAKAERLYYITLTQSLSARDDILSAAAATRQTCAQIFDAETCAKVSNTYTQLGL